MMFASKLKILAVVLTMGALPVSEPGMPLAYPELRGT